MITRKTYEIKKEDIPAGTYITNCIDCNQTCHYPCGIDPKSDKKECSAMDSSYNCKICTKKCSYEKHANMQFKFSVIEKNETVKAEEVYKTFIDSKSGKSRSL